MEILELRKRCGCIPEKVDLRNRIMLADAVPESLLEKESLPGKVDYSGEAGPVGNQGEYGSCVGWATVDGLKEWQELKEKKKRVELSVMYVWNKAKEIDEVPDNEWKLEEGTTIRAAMKVLKDFGVPEEKYWVYGGQPAVSQKELDTIGREYRIGHYFSMRSHYTRRYRLAKRGPFVIDVPVYNNWSFIDSSGIVPLPPQPFMPYETDYYDPVLNPAGRFLGGHALLVVGYDDEKRHFKFKNSWGKTWGDSGFGYFSYEFIQMVFSPPYSTLKASWECYAAVDMGGWIA